MKLVAFFLTGSCALLISSTPPPTALCKSGETTLFAFNTKSGKTASLCRGPKGNYLVYRFGTPGKIELQYPAVLNASSWRKFTYWSYTRGGGPENEGHETSQLKFENAGVEYTLSDETIAVYDKNHEEVYRREVGIDVLVKGKTTSVVGSAATAIGALSKVQDGNKVKIDEDMQ